MKRLFYSLSGLGLISILVIGTAISDARADHTSSPLRGTWSWSQFVPATTALGTPNPIPTAAAGTFVMARDNSFTGHAVLNTPLGPAIELDIDGTCTFRNEDVSNGVDCLVNVPAFHLSNLGRFCVVMAKNIWGCFDEFRCVNTESQGQSS